MGLHNKIANFSLRHKHTQILKTDINNSIKNPYKCKLCLDKGGKRKI